MSPRIEKDPVEKVLLEMLNRFQHRRAWQSVDDPNDYPNAQTVRQCCWTSGEVVKATYNEIDETVNLLNKQCFILGYGENITVFNYAVGTTIEMVRILISSCITARTSSLRSTTPSRPPSVAPVAIHPPHGSTASSVFSSPQSSPPTEKEHHADEEYRRHLLPATPEAPYVFSGVR